ncbi:MAG: ferritin-like domain-containing protein [Lacipirellulaceae bacterium]
MVLDTLEKLFVHELKDLYSAESQLAEALPKMADGASDPSLKAAFKHHLAETKVHLERLDQIFSKLDYSPKGHKCAGMEGLLKEGAELLKAEGEKAVIDAALIGAAQRVEHYEMAGYGTAYAFAEKLRRYDDSDLLQQTLEEEGATDRTLSRIAWRIVNYKASEA